LRLILHSSLKTGVYVYRLKSKALPNIGDVLVGENFKVRVLDVIGPVTEPFLVVKPLRGSKLPERVEAKVSSKRR